MSSNLDNTRSLLAQDTFTARVRAAMVEQAKKSIAQPPASWDDRMKSDRLAMAVIYDADQPTRVMARLCADDKLISQSATVDGVPDDELRRVVTEQWVAVASSMPNL